MVKAVIFDLDGTLIDTIQELSNASNYALTRLGFPNWEVEDYRTFVGNGIRRLLLRSLPENAKDKIDIARSYFNEYYSAHVLDTAPPYNGIRELIKELKSRGIRIAVNTNKAQEYASALIDKVFPGEFERVIGDEGGFPRKPEPAAALYLAELLGVRPEECIFLGDSGVDLETAKNAGMISVVCSWGFVYRDVLMSMNLENIIDRPEELVDLIEKISDEK